MTARSLISTDIPGGAGTRPTTLPTNALWWDTTAKLLKFYDGTKDLMLEFDSGAIREPEMNGFISESFDAEDIVAGTAPTSGLQHFQKHWMDHDVTVSNIWVYISTVGATLTAGANNLAIYDSTGTRIAATADQTTNYTTTGIKSIPLTASVALTGGTYYWVGFKSTGTTPAAFGRKTTSLTTSTANANLSASLSKYATNGTSTTTLMPATITLSSFAQVTTMFWTGLS